MKIEDDLNTEHSRAMWLEWKRRIDPSHYPDPKTRAEAAESAQRSMVADGLIDRGSRPAPSTLLNEKGNPNFGLNFYVLNARGEFAGVSMYESHFAVCTAGGPQTLPTEPLFAEKLTG